MDAPSELELKPDGESGRPLSWSEREDLRRQRKRSAVMIWIGHAFQAVTQRSGSLMRSMGMIRNKIIVDGVVYRESNNTSLQKALTGSGAGVKEYDVTFVPRAGDLKSAQYSHRESMRIRYTNKRVFSDLGHDPRLRFAELVKSHIRPGSRVLDLGCGTGGGSALLSDFVGPAGGVVAVHRDGESIRYARQRWRCDHLAFELGWIETLAGELDGSFDAAVALDVFRDSPDSPSKSRAVASVCRVVKNDGVILVICTDRNRLEDVTDRFEAVGISHFELLDPDPVLLWGGAIVFLGKEPENDAAKR